MTDVDQADSDSRARDLGDRIRLRRSEVGANQADVGAVAGVHRATIRAVETGKPVEARTMANVKRALGCSPNANFTSREGPETLRPVLSPRATAILLSAVLRSDEPERATQVSDYFDLVNALSEWPPDLPATLHRFWDSLTFLVPPAELRLVDVEVREFISANYARLETGVPAASGPPYVAAAYTGPGRTGDPLPNAVAGAVAQSGLPQDMQRIILDGLAERQADLRAQVVARLDLEAEHLVGATQRAIAAASEAAGESPDSPRVQRIVAGVLRESMRAMWLGITGSPSAQPSDQPR